MKCSKTAGPTGDVAEMLKAAGEEGVELERQLAKAVSAAVWTHQTGRRASFLTSIRARVKPLTVAIIVASSSQIKSAAVWVLDFYICEMVNIDEMQFGFVPGKGTTDTIFVVRQLQEKYIATNNLLWPWESLRSGAKEGPMVGLKEPRGRGMGCACHPGHVLQCLESCAGQWSVQWGVWRGSRCASGFCP